jgi:hypothetical protein
MTYHANSKPMANGIGQFTGKLQAYRDGSLGQFHGPLRTYRDGILGEPPGGKMPGANASFRDGVLGEYFSGAAGMGGVLGEYFAGVGQSDETAETPIPTAPQEVLPVPATSLPVQLPAAAPTGPTPMQLAFGAATAFGIYWWWSKRRK